MFVFRKLAVMENWVHEPVGALGPNRCVNVDRVEVGMVVNNVLSTTARLTIPGYRMRIFYSRGIGDVGNIAPDGSIEPPGRTFSAAQAFTLTSELEEEYDDALCL